MSLSLKTRSHSYMHHLGHGSPIKALFASGFAFVAVLASVTFTLPAIAAVQSVDATLVSVACPSATLCLGVGEANNEAGAVPLDPSSGQVASGQSVQSISGIGTDGNGLSAVACASATVCLAVGTNTAEDPPEAYAVPLDPSTGQVASGQSVQDIASNGFLDAVACASATLCVGVGSSGLVVPLDPSTGQVASGQSVQDISGTSLHGVACPSATLCVAVGETSPTTGAAVPLDPTTGQVASGQSVQAFAGTTLLLGVACASTTGCLAVGYYYTSSYTGVAAALDPTTGMVLAAKRADDLGVPFAR